MAYRLKDYLYNDKLTKEQNILMDRLYKLRMSGMAEAFEKQLLEPNTGLEPANYAQTECQFRYCGTAIPFLTVRSTAR